LRRQTASLAQQCQAKSGQNRGSSLGAYSVSALLSKIISQRSGTQSLKQPSRATIKEFTMAYQAELRSFAPQSPWPMH
jgi:hypothetical protein